MKKLFIVCSIAIEIWACSCGNQNFGETGSETSHAASDSAGLKTEAVPGADSTVSSEPKPAASSAIESLKMGMKENEVISLLGEPTKKESVGKDAKMTIEDWWYGENQKVRMIKGEVNNVVKDVAHQKELLQQLMEANKKKDQEEVKRIMDELTQGQTMPK